MEVQYTFVLRYQGMAVAEADATAHLDLDATDHWFIDRITLRDLDDLRDVDLIGDDLHAETRRLHAHRGFCEDAENVASSYIAGRISYDRELARSAAE